MAHWVVGQTGGRLGVCPDQACHPVVTSLGQYSPMRRDCWDQHPLRYGLFHKFTVPFCMGSTSKLYLLELSG